MAITQITYERVFNLGSYESERISATATVDEGAIDRAYDEARLAVANEHARTLAAKQQVADTGGASYNEPPASDKQRAYIATLQEKAGWTSEDLLRYASEQSIDLAELTKTQASLIIDHLQKEARQEGIVTNWARPLVTGRKEQSATVAEEGDLPF